jgi:transposase InsO family protein
VCRYPSKKMGVVIQAESHRHELALLYVLERDLDVIGFWDQPEGIKITYASASGRPTSPTITPDYLVLRTDRVEWIEVKPHDALPELAREMPRRYAFGQDGRWGSPPAEAAAQAYGFRFRIWTAAEVDPKWLQNIQFLADYFGADLDPVPPDIRKKVNEAVQIEQGISLHDLRERCNVTSADQLNQLIASDQLYVDLKAALLSDPRRVRIFSCREAAETIELLTQGLSGNGSCRKSIGGPSPGDRSFANGHAEAHGNSLNGHLGILAKGSPGDHSSEVSQLHAEDTELTTSGPVTSLQLSPDAAELFRRASPDDLAAANRRHRILTDAEFGKQSSVPKRTLRRWRRLFRFAEDRYGYGLLGLIPRFKDRGNHGSHFCNELLELVERTIDGVYCTPTRPNRRHAYDQLRIQCEEKGHVIPSYPWFTKRIALRSKYSLALSREGKRVAHRYELIRPGEPNGNHGAFPWDVCLTDHTLTDVELVCSETGENLGRAWLSILIDGFSRRVLAFVLNFDPPSYRTLMLLVRRCVERHGRLPGCLVVDGGKEFQSVYFETLTAAYGVVLKRRPGGKPKFGAIVERIFGTINTSFLHTLQGNTQNTKNVRGLVKSMNPKGLAVYTLEELHEMLSVFAFEFYNKRPHPALNSSPEEKYAKGVEISGARVHRAVVFNEAFRLMTLPTTPKGTAKIQPAMGFKLAGLYYWAPEMRSRHVEGKSVQVKYDPENLGVAWAYLEDHWIQCRPNGTLNLDGRTEKEMRLATLEWRRSRQRLGHRQSNSLRDFAVFLRSTEAAKALRIQQAKDRALRRTVFQDAPQEAPSSTQFVDTAESIPPADTSLTETCEPCSSPPSVMKDYGDF